MHTRISATTISLSERQYEKKETIMHTTTTTSNAHTHTHTHTSLGINHNGPSFPTEGA
jgi:hypothetical protein